MMGRVDKWGVLRMDIWGLLWKVDPGVWEEGRDGPLKILWGTPELVLWTRTLEWAIQRSNETTGLPWDDLTM